MVIGNKKIGLPVLFLILANLQPLFGVLFFNWSIFSVLFLYWFESAIIGFYNLLKIMIVPIFLPDEATKKLGRKIEFPAVINIGVKVVYIPFFIFHYGLFMLVHFIFINGIFNQSAFNLDSGIFDSFKALFFANIDKFWFPALLLFISHGISFIVNFVMGKEYQKTSMNKLMAEPYTRVMLMQFVIIFGAIIMDIFGVPSVFIFLLVMLKIISDVLAHLKQHKKYKAIQATAS